ncbi:MAG: ATP-binding protein [Bacteroidota bacterium]
MRNVYSVIERSPMYVYKVSDRDLFLAFRLLGIVLFCLWLRPVSAQSSASFDSLYQQLPSVKDTHYVWALIDLAKACPVLDSALVYNQEAIDLARSLDFRKGTYEARYRKAETLRLSNKHRAAIAIYDELLAERPDLPQSYASRWITIYARKAYSLRQLGKSSEAMSNLMAGIHLSDSLNFPEHRIKMLFELVEIHRLRKDREQAMYYLDQIESQHDLTNDLFWYCRIVFTKAIILKGIEDEQEVRRGIKMLEDMLEGRCKDGINSRLKAITMGNIGAMYIDIGEFEQAEKVLAKTLAIKRALNNKVSLAYTLNEIATLHNRQEQYEACLQYAEEAYTYVNAGKDIFLLNDVLDNLFDGHGYLGNFEKAKQFRHEREEIRDSIYTLEKVAALAEMQTKYDLAKKEQALAMSNEDLTRQQAKLNTTILIALLLISVIGGLLLWSRVRWKNKALEAQRLQEINELKSRFFANISHEFRTPLTLMLNALKAEEVAKDNTQRQILHRNVLRLKRLIDQMLDLSKLEAGKMILQAQLCDMDQVLREYMLPFEGLARQKGIDMQYHLIGSAPKAYVDVDQLEKIISNLLLNALKFTQEGGRVRVELSSDDHHLTILVKDNGIGIAADQMPHIFDRFQRAASNAYEGSGLGLNLVQELVHMHKGTIEVESQPGRGSCFSIQWPLGDQHLSPAERFLPIAPKRPKSEQHQPDLLLEPMPNGVSHAIAVTDRPIILLIEDNADLRFQLRQQLEQAFLVIEAADGQQGIEIAIEKIPDLIICDVMMPQKNGYVVSEVLKKDTRTSHIPIILLTALASQVDKLKGLAHGVDDYLFKPFDQRELQLRIHNLIEQRELLRQHYNQTSLLKPREIRGRNKDEQFLEELLVVVERHMSDEGFGVEAFSKAMHLSRSQLHRKLKAMTGLSPSAYLRQVRLERARQLLQKDIGNVSEVAFQVGFANIPYFHKCFKEQFGMTPGEILRSQ